MLRLIKKLLNISSKESVESYLQVLESGDKMISFMLHLNNSDECEQMLLALIQIKHPKNFQILAYQHKSFPFGIVVELCFPSRKRNTQEVCKLIVDILNQESEIKKNGKSNRET